MCVYVLCVMNTYLVFQLLTTHSLGEIPVLDGGENVVLVSTLLLIHHIVLHIIIN